MNVINIQEAKTHLSRYVEQVAAGGEIIIGKAGRPMARLVPYQPEAKPRLGGQLKGRIVESEDCWEPGDDLLRAAAGPVLYPAPRKAATRRVAEGRNPK